MVKNLPVNAGDLRGLGSIPGSERDSLEEGMATHSSILAWRIPWTEEPGGLQPMGTESDRTEGTLPASTVASLGAQMQRIHLQCGRPGFHPWVGKICWRSERLPTPVFLPGEFHGQRSLVGLQFRGSRRIGHY